MNSPGRLYLIPAPIGGTDPLRSLPPETIAAMRGIRHFVVESERTAARLLSSVLSREALRETSFWILDEHTPANSIPGLLEPALAGQDIGLMSEVGCPCIADPGSGLVAEAHRLGMRVLPLAGPSSILMALMASGFNGQSFVFLGYLPARAEKRRATLKRIEGEARRDGSTRVFIETPYRNRVLLEDALKVLDGGTMLCVAVSLGSASERIRSAPVRSWRTGDLFSGKEPAVFLLAPERPGPAGRLTKTGLPLQLVGHDKTWKIEPPGRRH